MTKEYGDLKPGEMSVATTLATRPTPSTTGRVQTWKLKHHTAGYECAGSCARYTNEKWSVTGFAPNTNTTRGNSFSTESEARSVFSSDTPWYRPVPEGLQKGASK